ncbi:neprilysin-4-like [Teleopsis dalmanni]|uniref:neprilysin-4-like n=1 Tax=Teleopsis dalmanni TaxID=139649 RepID=UPI0018CD3A72|nr:neprilysin-4-like [Teleopsis dalmanni]
MLVLLLLVQVMWVISKPTDSIDFVRSNNVIENDVSINVPENTDLQYRIEYAKLMKTFMNESVNPCDDFYEYACGNWKNVIEERYTEHKRSNGRDIKYKLNDAVEKILNDSVENLTNEYANEFKLAQQFYQSCLSADLYPTTMSQVYIDVIKSIGGFPAIDETWQSTNFSWLNMSAHLTNYDVDGLIKEDIRSLYPFPPYFKKQDLGFDYVVNSDNIASNTTQSYISNEKSIRHYLSVYGVEEGKISQIVDEIFDFWRAILKPMDEFEESAEVDVEPFWRDYFDIAWMGQKFNESVTNYYHFSSLYNKLNTVCNEHKEAAANYLALQFLYGMDAKLKKKEFQKEYCLIDIQYTFRFLIDKFYLEKYFNEGIKTEVTKLVKEIQKSVRQQIEQAEWLDEKTRTEALLKESTMQSQIGKFVDPGLSERLIREINNLNFDPDNYEQNNLNLKKFRTFMNRYLGLHNEDIHNETKPLIFMIGMQVNAFYYHIDKSIYIMAGILHPPVYHKSWPNSLKFGTLGSFVGHEFTHGFVSTGANYDSNGDRRNWWTEETEEVFNNRTDCYEQHFNDYLIPEINRKINGYLSKNENIADNGGLRAALNSYRKYMKELNKEGDLMTTFKDEDMPGLNLSPEQLFFVGFAQLYCASYNEKHYWEELTNRHTIDKYRVLGTLSNMEDFSKVYECPLGSNMNKKEEKCRIW